MRDTSKRQLVYKLNSWGAGKYNASPADKHPRDDSEIELPGPNPQRSKFGFEASLSHPWPPPAPVPFQQDHFSPSGAVEFGALTTGPAEAASNFLGRTIVQIPAEQGDLLSSLLTQYINECLKSGTILVDDQDPIAKGFRLFQWAQNIMHTVEMLDSFNTPTVNAFEILVKSQVEHGIMDTIIRDEHPQFLGSVFSIWASIYKHLRPDSSDSSVKHHCSRLLIGSMARGCRRILGRHHVITKIFDCLVEGTYEPETCVERLMFLPSSFYANRDDVNKWVASIPLSFDRSDSAYGGSVASMALATRIHWPGNQLLQRPSGSDQRWPNTIAELQRTESDRLAPMVTLDRDWVVPSDCSELDSEILDTSSEHEPEESSSYPGDNTVSVMETEITRIVNNLMAVVLQNLDELVSIISCPKDGAPYQGGSQIPNQQTTSTSNQGSKVEKNEQNKRKRPAGGWGEEDDEDCSTPPKKQAIDGDREGPHLACPYFKHNPRKYNRSPCSGPGWGTISRLK
jgi:hypothetical protein